MGSWRVLAALWATSVCGACGAVGARQPESADAIPPASAEAEAVLSSWRVDIDSLSMSIDELDSAAQALRAPHDLVAARAAFRDARRRFKRVEGALEYYAPSTARAMNGPPVPEVEETEGPENVLAPSGFQVIEGLLFSPDAMAALPSLRSETATLRAFARRLRTMFAAQRTTDAHVWDAARLEVNRIMVLGLAGFDVAASGDAVPEALAALEGVSRTLAPYARRVSLSPWSGAVAAAQSFLAAPAASASLDYLTFIAQYGQPLAHALVDARDRAGVGLPAERRAFRMSAASLFDRDAIDVDAFAPLGLEQAPPARVALGRALFRDGRLSGNGSRSCVSCHNPSLAFTDGRPQALGMRGERLARNTPTMLNAGLQVGHFADLRTTYLEDQIAEVIGNPLEMHGELDRAARDLASDAGLLAQFRAAFPPPHGPDATISPLRIRQAIAAYIRSLSRLDAPVDRALRGDTAALSPDARAGLNLYVGKARCASCHFLPLTGGTVPPMYQRAELEVLGVPARAAVRGATVDSDPGRFAVSRSEPHRHAFRTPSLRNVAQTAPYMHNGVYRTLEQVIDFYDRGGGIGIGASVANQTLSSAPLRLTVREKQQLQRFLEALTDTTALR